MPEPEPILKTDIPMASPYKQVPTNGSCRLYEGIIRLQDDYGEITGQGCIDFNLLGSPGYKYEITHNATFSPDRSTTKLTLPETDNCSSTAVLELKSKTNYPEGVTRAEGIFNGDGLTLPELSPAGKQEPVGRIVFHLINFLEFHGTSLVQADLGGENRWAGRVVFPLGKWIVTLDQFRDIGRRREEAKATNGYAFTHVGQLKRNDNKLFSPDDGEKVLEPLYWLLSFMNGARCAVALPVGLRYMDRPLWRRWQSWSADPPSTGLNWFSRFAGLLCFASSQPFHNCWSQAGKREWLTTAIGLYLASNQNTNGIELALASSQIALEMLTWVALLEENSLMSEKSFDGLPAADKIRALLFWLHIPTSVPAPFTALQNAFPQLDAPEKSVKLRNFLIHQTKANRAERSRVDDFAVYEAWQLNLWYIELTILKLIGYSGAYNSRAGNPSDRFWSMLPRSA